MKYCSQALAYDSINLSISETRWLGVHSQDIITYKIPLNKQINVTQTELNLLNNLKKGPIFKLQEH